MSPAFEFRPPVRAGAPLLIGLAGGTGSGKTYSALRLARGLAGGDPFALVDTENGRALHYADYFPDMRHAVLAAPFSPSRYMEAILDADKAGFPVIVVDSASHEWEGEGGILDMQIAEYKKLGGYDSVKMLSWAAPKQEHKRFVSRLLQTRAHVILCFRAEDKIDMVKDDKGKTVVVPKASLTGHDGWIPICEKRLPFEMTLSLLFTADRKGIPQVIKLEGHHEPFVPLDRQLGEESGKQLAAWAAGGIQGSAPGGAPSAPAADPGGPADDPPGVRRAGVAGAEQTTDDPVEAAGRAIPPQEFVAEAGKGMTLDEILDAGGHNWLKWALDQDVWDPEFRAQLETFARAKLGAPVAA